MENTPSALDQPQWFVCQCNPQRMVHSVRTLLDRLNAEYYMALHTVLVRRGGQMVETEESWLGHFFFLKSSLRQALKFKFTHGLDYNYVRDAHKQLLVIPDQQLADFKRVIETMREKVNFDADYFAVGDAVVVTRGRLCGVRGLLVRIDNKEHLLLRIEGVMAISVRIAKSSVRKIGGSQ